MTIISFKHQFIFIRPMKVAGTSLEIALSRFCGEDDKMSVLKPLSSNELRAHRYYPYPVRDTIELVSGSEKRIAHLSDHMTAKRLRHLCGHDVFHRFLKISVIRNPYDWLVSFWMWNCRGWRMRRDGPVSKFRAWLLGLADKEPRFERERERSTLSEPYDAIDVMVRFERFEEDLTALSHKLGLTENIYDTFKELREKGQARPRSFTAHVCFEGFPEGIEKVKKCFAIELEKFGYDLPWLSGGLSGGRSADRERL